MKSSNFKKLGFMFFAFFALIFGFASNELSVSAAATSGDFALKPGGETNDNVNIDNGAYAVTGDPGQKVELKLLVINKENTTRKFLFRANTAYTTDGGVLGFDKSKVSDSSLKLKVGSIIDPNKGTFTIPANATATITTTLTIPTKSFKGYLMGGFNVQPYKEKAKGTVSSNGTLIKNKFSYSIPVQVHQKGADNDEAKYSVRTVKPTIVSGSSLKNKQGVQANVHNSTNSYMGDLSSKAVVTKKGDKKFKKVVTKSNQQIAPTSNYNYQIPWGNQSLQAGDYHLKLTYKVGGGLKSWVINKDFTITNSDAAKYNKLAGIKPNYLWLYILLGILALAIILGLGIYMGRRNNNNNNGGNNGNNKPSKRRRR